MKILLLIFTTAVLSCKPFAQDTDSLEFVKKFNEFNSGYPLEFAQLSRYDSLNNRLDTNNVEKLRKTLELLYLINKIDKSGIRELKQDSSDLLAYSSKKKKYYLFIDENVNFEKVEEFTGFKIALEFKKFSKILSQKGEVEIFSYKIPRKDSGGIQVPIFINPNNLVPSANSQTTEEESIQLANNYWSSISKLLTVYICKPNNPKVLDYYKAQEKPSDSWKTIAGKRRKFIDFIKAKCLLK